MRNTRTGCINHPGCKNNLVTCNSSCSCMPIDYFLLLPTFIAWIPMIMWTHRFPCMSLTWAFVTSLTALARMLDSMCSWCRFLGWPGGKGSGWHTRLISSLGGDSRPSAVTVLADGWLGTLWWWSMAWGGLTDPVSSCRSKMTRSDTEKKEEIGSRKLNCKHSEDPPHCFIFGRNRISPKLGSDTKFRTSMPRALKLGMVLLVLWILQSILIAL